MAIERVGGSISNAKRHCADEKCAVGMRAVKGLQETRCTHNERESSSFGTITLLQHQSLPFPHPPTHTHSLTDPHRLSAHCRLKLVNSDCVCHIGTPSFVQIETTSSEITIPHALVSYRQGRIMIFKTATYSWL